MAALPAPDRGGNHRDCVHKARIAPPGNSADLRRAPRLLRAQPPSRIDAVIAGSFIGLIWFTALMPRAMIANKGKAELERFARAPGTRRARLPRPKVVESVSRFQDRAALQATARRISLGLVSLGRYPKRALLAVSD